MLTSGRRYNIPTDYTEELEMRYRQQLFVNSVWKSRSGVEVIIKRYDHGKVWYVNMRKDDGQHMLTRGSFIATFPISENIG